jgi:hypothetical protein
MVEIFEKINVKKIKRNKKSLTALLVAEISTKQWNHLLDTAYLPAPTKLRNRKAKYAIRNLCPDIFARFITIFLETDDEALKWNVTYFIIDETHLPSNGITGTPILNYRVEFRIHITDEESIALFALTY